MKRLRVIATDFNMDFNTLGRRLKEEADKNPYCKKYEYTVLGEAIVFDEVWEKVEISEKHKELVKELQKAKYFKIIELDKE